MNPRNVGELILTRLKQLGTDCFFANPGTEFISIIRGFQELPSAQVPRPILAPHEFLAVTMAYGHFLTSGRPQAVMTHANVGAANALIGLIGACRMNIPLIFISGMTSQTERDVLGRRDKLIHWSQDARDQGSVFREYVKWEATISYASSAADILDRAFAIAMSPPYGPVAIKVARDVLVSEVAATLNATPTQAHSPPAPDPKAMDNVTRILASAKKPILITNRTGLDPSMVFRLAELSKKNAIGVLTPEDFYVSFPGDHPNHLGYENIPALKEADAVVVLDCEAPWFPIENGPSEAKIIHVGPDPLFASLPLRSHRGDFFLQSHPSNFLSQLTTLEVTKDLKASREKWIQSKKLSANEAAAKWNAESISSVLSEFISAESILINELGLSPRHLQLRMPGTYFRSGSASPLGWAVGCALGLGIADKKQIPVAAIGDGVFYFSPMTAALQTSVAQDAPFITLVLNNGGMTSISKTSSDFYPGLSNHPPLTQFQNTVEFERTASLVGGLALRARNADELRSALQSARDFCRTHRKPAVINVIY